jgi:hypothetical protein
MNMQLKIILWVLPFFICLTALADDTVVGLGSGGLEFLSTDEIEMVQEDLTISTNIIDARYIFRNITDHPVKIMVAFPLPIIDFSKFSYYGPAINLPKFNGSNFVDFKTYVNNQIIETKVETKALVNYSDISNELRKLNINFEIPGPQGFNENISKKLSSLKKADQEKLIKLGAIQNLKADDSQPDLFYENWSLVTLYYWTQTFPVGQTVQIRHTYHPIIEESAGFGALLTDYTGKPIPLVLEGTPDARYPADSRDYFKPYCMTDEFWKLAREKNTRFSYESKKINFILKTANAWRKPIGEFNFIIERNNPDSLVSLCMDGIKKVSPTRFKLTKTNFIPDKDIDIFFLETNKN